MIFRQLFERESSTYTYLIGCEKTREAVLIDTVKSELNTYLTLLAELDLKLICVLDTHTHADHITAARHLKERVGSRIASPAIDRLPCTDHGIEDGVPFELGSIKIDPIHTPGHTDGHFAYQLGERLFTGDALLIDGCGRTDFQNGDARVLYRSVRERLFTLPDEQLVYPAHDYQQRCVSSIGQEKARNPRLGGGRTLEQFVELMAGLNLPYPKFIDFAVLGNRDCGVCPTDTPEHLKAYCERMAESPQG